MKKISFNENGNLCTQDGRFVSYTIDGGDILGVASGNLTTKAIYIEPNKEVYRGRALLVVKNTEKVVISAMSDGVTSATIQF